VIQSGQARADDLIEARQFLLQMGSPACSQGIGLPSIGSAHRPDPTALFKPRYRTVKGARSEPNTRKPLYVVHHAVAVFIAFGEAG
jgi:hypothetical protein